MKRQNLFLQLDIMEYSEAWELQKLLLDARISDKIKDCFLLLQHPPTFTFGRRYKEINLIANKRQYEDKGFAIYKTDRGGLATYHGPGQIVGYPIIKMCTYTKDYYQYLRMLEEVMIRTLSDFGIGAERKEEYTGVWINKAKIGFIGVRIVLGYTMHGFSLNVNNDVSPFNYITPCGIQGVTTTSVQELSRTKISVSDVYTRIASHYSEVFQIQLLPVEMELIFQKIGFKKKRLLCKGASLKVCPA
ncbi:MAG: lipoyl(octanoyl) transferase LipB [Candidatus Jettenia sp. CY-1]|nr:MAG: lipoyl(octanoyl) transferase LipB [Candidatus Jettenia sp. CY-1]